MEVELDAPQWRAVNKFVKEERGIAWWAMGEGKTRIALSTFALLQFRGILIVVTRPAAFHDWRNEVLKVGFNWFVAEYDGPQTSFSRRRPTMWLVSHGKLAKLLPHLQVNPLIEFVVYDELYLYSNPKTLKSKAAARLTQSVGGRALGLSGTIMPAKDNTSIWGQTLACGVSGKLARNLTDFRSRYQTCSLLDFGKDKQARQFCNKANSKELILSRLEPVCDLHFPIIGKRLIHEKINTVPITPEQKALIKKLKNEYYLELQEHNMEIDISTALGLIIKVQNISNGWLSDSAGTCISIKSNKVEALRASLDELLSEGGKCIVWCAFKRDTEVLKAALPFAILQMSGGCKFDTDAWATGKYQVVLATEGSGASVNHFAQVAYAKYFSMSFKWLDFQQSKARTDRKNSAHPTCHYEYFHTAGTLDRHVFDGATSSGRIERDFIKTGRLLQWLKDN